MSSIPLFVSFMLLVLMQPIRRCSVFEFNRMHHELIGCNWVNQNGERILVTAIVDILRSSVLRKRQIHGISLYTKVSQKNCLQYFGDLTDGLMQAVGQQVTVRIGVQRPISADTDRHCCVLLVDSAESLKCLYTEFLTYRPQISGSFIILLYKPDDHYSDDLHEAVKLNWEIGAVDANILVRALPELILLFTGFPYTRFHCGRVIPVIINRFTGDRWHNRSQFFVEKLLNLHGCRLVCATWEDLPYFKVRNNTNSSSNSNRVEFTGIEGKMLEHLQKSLNFSVDFLWMNDDEIAETLQENSSIFSKLFEKGAEFSIGAYYYKPTSASDPYAPTTGYYSSSLDIVVNSKNRAYSPFAKLLFPFVEDLWGIIVVIFIVAITTTFVAGFLETSRRNFILGDNNNTPIYNMFVVTLGGGLSLLPHRNFARFLLFLWILASLILRSAYQALLYHFIRTDVSRPPPRTIEDVIMLNYTILMTEVYWCAVEDLPQIRSRALVLKNMTQFNSFELLGGENASDIAILTPFEYYGHYKRLRSSAIDFFVVPGHVFTQQLSIYMRKNSIILPRFNQWILIYNSAGLLQKAESDFVDRSGQSAWGVRGESGPQRLQLNQLYGANILLAFGCCLATLAFISECVIFVLGRRLSRSLVWNGRTNI